MVIALFTIVSPTDPFMIENDKRMSYSMATVLQGLERHRRKPFIPASVLPAIQSNEAVFRSLSEEARVRWQSKISLL